MWVYLVCIPYAIIYYVLAAYLSKRLNDDPASIYLFSSLWVIQLFGIWPIMARYSKNIIFDGTLYDMLIFISYYLTLILMGAGKGFTAVQWGGCLLVLVGLLVLKLG